MLGLGLIERCQKNVNSEPLFVVSQGAHVDSLLLLSDTAAHLQESNGVYFTRSGLFGSTRGGQHNVRWLVIVLWLTVFVHSIKTYHHVPGELLQGDRVNAKIKLLLITTPSWVTVIFNFCQLSIYKVTSQTF